MHTWSSALPTDLKKTKGTRAVMYLPETEGTEGDRRQNREPPELLGVSPVGWKQVKKSCWSRGREMKSVLVQIEPDSRHKTNTTRTGKRKESG